MAATAAQVARLRRMVGELTDLTYSDDDLEGYIERYPLEDARGEAPQVESTTVPGTLEENADWTATYDLHAAAAEIWQEKAAAAFVMEPASPADEAKAKRATDLHTFAMQQSRYHMARRSITTVTLRPEPLAQGTEELDEEEI